MKKGITAIVVIVCIVAGFAAGWFIPALLPAPPRVTLVDTIKARGKLIVGTDAPWPPFELYNITTDEWTGFDIALSKMIADELNVTLEMQNIGFDLLIESCKAGTIDMVAAAMMVTAERALELAHSVPYIRVNEVVIAKGDSTINITSIANLTAYKVGCQLGTTQQEALDGLDMTEGVDYIAYPKADTLMLNLENGVVDLAFVDEPVLTVYAKLYGFKSIFTVPAEPTALWCKWEEPELLQLINKVILEAFADGTMDDLIVEWFG